MSVNVTVSVSGGVVTRVDVDGDATVEVRDYDDGENILGEWLSENGFTTDDVEGLNVEDLEEIGIAKDEEGYFYEASTFKGATTVNSDTDVTRASHKANAEDCE